MKLYAQSGGAITQSLCAIAEVAGCTVVSDMDSADELLCISAQEALDFLLAGKRVVLILIASGDSVSAEALMKNERFREHITVFRFLAKGEDSDEMKRLLTHWQS